MRAGIELHFLQMLLVVSNKCRKIPQLFHLHIPSGRYHSEWNCQNVAIYQRSLHWDTLCSLMNVLLQVENCLCVAPVGYNGEPGWLNRRFNSCQSADSWTFCSWFGFNYNIWFLGLLTVKIIITSSVLPIPSQEIPSPLYPESQVHV
jgi:hypothetical protein